MPESLILRSRFVLERASGDYRRLVALRDIHRVPGIRNFDAWGSRMNYMMDRVMGTDRHYPVYSKVPSGKLVTSSSCYQRLEA